MANEIFKAPAGFLVVLARERRYCPAASPSNSSSAPGQAAERLSITEMTLDPHRLAPPHVHADQDEYTYVAAGTIGVRVADEEFEAAQGCYLLKPRTVAHAFWNPTDKLARTVEVIAPAGFEAYFEELAAASATGDARQTQQRRADLAAKYRLGYFTELAPALKAKHRLKLIGE
jgi:quercetin dioxygenase-like cupin family protein